MSKKAVLSLLVCCLLAVAASAGPTYQVNITRMAGYYTGSGGEFTLSPTAAARLSSPKSTRRATIRSGFSHKVSRDSLPRAKSRGQLQSDPSTRLGTKIAQKAARTVEVPA